MNFIYKISQYNRQRKWQLFLKEFKPTKSLKILDVGYSNYDGPTENFLEKNYPYLEKITALGVEKAGAFKKKFPKIKVVQYSGARFPFKNKDFDIVWSNAVLEHVGDFKKQILFLKEVNRTGKAFFITTPNRWFPVEVHTKIPLLHFFPKKVFDLFLRLFGKKWATGNYMFLLSKRKLKKLLKKAGIKNYQIVENRFLGFCLDFVVLKKDVSR